MKALGWIGVGTVVLLLIMNIVEAIASVFDHLLRPAL